jgi:hypothetical protein
LITGAKAGIGIAALTGLVILFLGIAYWWARRQKESQQHPCGELDSKMKAEMQGVDMQHELHGDGGEHVLPVLERSQELLGDGHRHELPV